MAPALAWVLFLTSHALPWAGGEDRGARMSGAKWAASETPREPMSVYTLRNLQMDPEAVSRHSWFLHGASMPTSQGMLLLPPVPDRHGLIWNNASLNTTKWEAQIRFQIPHTGRTRGEPMGTDAAFGFFISPQQISEVFDVRRLYDSLSEGSTWTQWMETEQLTLAGYMNPFKGVGIVFHHADHQPRITCMADPPQAVDLRVAPSQAIDWVPTYHGADDDGFWLSLRIRSIGNIMQVWLTTPQRSQQKVCDFKVNLPRESYIGFSGYTGALLNPASTTGGTQQRGSGVRVTEMTVFNFDDDALMRDIPGAVPTSAKDVAMHLLANHDHSFRDAVNQTRFIDELSTMLNAYAEQRFADIVDLSRQFDRVADAVQDVTYATLILHKEVGLVIGRKRPETLDTLIRNMRGLRDLMYRTNVEHSMRWLVVDDNLRDLSDNHATPDMRSSPLADTVARDANSFQRAVDARFKMTQLMFCLVVCVSLIICALLWRRLRYYEKQHFM
eukprot:GEMP01009195.1.p1 GENE.GEMP01009195.1~~GEMP01009195.1.p1  ORF type:complete len:500 (+),score=98.33 GEMP01009195.1:66-1565(+)